MNIRRTSFAIAGVLGASLTLSACTSTSSGSSTPEGSSPESSSGFNEQDVMFAQMMVPHHEQAVEMPDIILAKDDVDPEVLDIAQQIKDAQGPEIEQMNDWLEEWDASGDMGDMGDMGGMDHSMDGMMSDDEMETLEGSSAESASRLFLEQMTEHHEGAIDMAQTELDDGEYPDALELAQDIVDTQQSEIDQMQEILAGS